MAQLVKNSVTGYRLKTAEDFKVIEPIWNGYNTNPDQATMRVYAAQYSTTAAIATGSVSDSTTQPILSRKYNAASVFQYGLSNSRPVSFADTIGKTVTATSASDGIKFSGLTVDASQEYLCFVAKPSTAITMTFVLRSSVGNQRSFAFTTSAFTADSNGYVRFIAQNTAGSYTGVTVSDTGTPVMSSITEIDLTSSAAASIDWYDLQGGSNQEVFIGHQITEIFECLDEATWTDTLDTADTKCGLINTGKTATGLNLEITLKVRTLSAKGQAASKGEVLKRGAVDVMIVQNSPAGSGGLTQKTITAGVINIAGLNASRIMAVSLPGGVNLDRVESAALVNQTTYHYNATSGDFTFSTIYNGQIPTIIYSVSQVATYFDRKNLKTGFVGVLTVQRQADTGKTVQYIFPEVEITNVEASQEDSEVSHTYTLTAIPFKDGQNYRYYRQIEL